MKIYERSLQALLSSAPRSRVLARLASLAQIGELARRLSCFQYFTPVYQLLVPYDWCFLGSWRQPRYLLSFAHVETKKTHSERVKPSYTTDFDILTFFVLKLAGLWADCGICKNAYGLSSSLFPPLFARLHWTRAAIDLHRMKKPRLFAKSLAFTSLRRWHLILSLFRNAVCLGLLVIILIWTKITCKWSFSPTRISFQGFSSVTLFIFLYPFQLPLILKK